MLGAALGAAWHHYRAVCLSLHWHGRLKTRETDEEDVFRRAGDSTWQVSGRPWPPEVFPQGRATVPPKLVSPGPSVSRLAANEASEGLPTGKWTERVEVKGLPERLVEGLPLPHTPALQRAHNINTGNHLPPSLSRTPRLSGRFSLSLKG